MKSIANMIFHRFMVCVVMLFPIAVSHAQARLEIAGTANDRYLTHSVAPKENWYSIGRIYNISPKDMAPYNKLSLDKPLAIGQSLKIPLTDINFTITGAALDDEVLIALYHKVKVKEWMYRIATNYGVSVEQLEQWNAIKNDQLRSGMSLIVGYLKVKSALSSLAAAAVNPPIVKPAISVMQPIKAPEQAKKDTQIHVRDLSIKTAPQELQKPMEPIVTPVESSAVTSTVANFQGGAFKKQFGKGAEQLKGNAGIFKSTSGWNDGKYYALLNDVAVGTIIRISFSLTGKAVYAKVLGALPDMKESQGLVIRVSDAAASELGVVSSKFYVEIAY